MIRSFNLRKGTQVLKVHSHTSHSSILCPLHISCICKTLQTMQEYATRQRCIRCSCIQGQANRMGMLHLNLSTIRMFPRLLASLWSIYCPHSACLYRTWGASHPLCAHTFRLVLHTYRLLSLSDWGHSTLLSDSLLLRCKVDQFLWFQQILFDLGWL